MTPSRNHFYHWKKLQRRYRSVQARWVTERSNKLKRKLDILGRRLHSLNRKWKLGIAASALSCWMAALPSTTVQAQDTPFVPIVSTADLNGSNGFTLNGLAEYSSMSVSNAGDINGDGIDDLIIGSPYDRSYGDYEGVTYVVFGSRDGFSSPFELSSLDGDNGFTINGLGGNDYLGYSVSGAGDINGDGIDDLVIGASRASPNGTYSGASYVVFGSTGGFPSNFDLSSLDGNNGFTLNGIAEGDLAGTSVSNAGDINGDRIDDLVIGASYSASYNSGASYVVFGSTGGFPSTFNLSSLDGNNGFAINGYTYEYFGYSVSGAGDVNGDGIDDLVIGAPNGGSDYAGASYVVFGSTEGFASSFDLSSLDGNNGFVLNGLNEYDYFGRSVSNAGDVNGDGIDDLVFGVPNIDTNGTNAGASYVVFGSTEGFPRTFDLSSLDGNNGFALNGLIEFSGFGASVSNAGDINRDGVDDLIIGARNADPSDNANAGSAYVILGSQNGFDASIELSSLDGTNGFTLNGESSFQYFGRSVSGAGDFNGDGVDDVIIGDGDDFSHVIFDVMPPVLTPIGSQTGNEGIEITFEVSATDVHEKPLAFSLDEDSQNKGMTLSPAGTFTWTPSEIQAGQHEVTITVSDGSYTDSETFTLTVAENNAPVLAEIEPITGDFDTPIRFTASATDVDNNPITFSIDDDSIEKGMTIDATTGQFEWTPSLDQTGTHPVTVTASDGSLSDSQVVTITIRVITSLTDDLTSSIKLHPNPVEDRLQLVMNHAYLGDLALSLTDLNGRTLLKRELTKSNERMEVDLDMSTLRAGVYLIEIRSREGSLWEKQRILKR